MQAAQQAKQLKVEDALEYLEKVKKQFGSQPDIYNRFLEIMKNFKSQIIDTPGVIDAVSELFDGHPNLILGFNTFLPPGFKIEIGQIQHRQAMRRQLQQQQAAQAAAASHHVSHMINHNPPYMAHTMMTTPGMGHLHMPQMQMASMQHIAPAPIARPMVPQSTTAPPAFDKAVGYVTRIKERFQDDDSKTYKKFLDILHTYQQESRSIKEVLDKVSELFRYHPDLLREFTYFLPDAVQDEAKVRLNRAALKAQKMMRPKVTKKRMRKFFFFLIKTHTHTHKPTRRYRKCPSV